MKKDTKKAFELYSSAAEQGYPVALYNLASLYENGEAVEKDLAKAFELYNEAAEQGDEDALYNLACCYENGQGCDKNVEKAIELYKEVVENDGECRSDALADLKRLGVDSAIVTDSNLGQKRPREGAEKEDGPQESGTGKKSKTH